MRAPSSTIGATGFTLGQLTELLHVVTYDDCSAKYTEGQRRKAAKEGAALSDGSYPIYDQEDVDNANGLKGNGSAGKGTVEAHIRKRVRALGLKMPASMQGKS